MGKQGTPKATAKQTAAKSIAKAKAAPKGSAGKDASADAGSRQQMSAFVTSMKYKLTGRNKEQASTAQQLLLKPHKTLSHLEPKLQRVRAWQETKG